MFVKFIQSDHFYLHVKEHFLQLLIFLFKGIGNFRKVSNLFLKLGHVFLLLLPAVAGSFTIADHSQGLFVNFRALLRKKLV